MALSKNVSAFNESDPIVEASTVKEVRHILSKIKEGAVIFLDVDDTLITPESKVFRAKSPYRFLIDDLKKNKDQYPNFEVILSHWRLQRKTILISDQWPDLIYTLKQQYPIYALTKMDSGPIGDISSMEEWRYNELKKKGISFATSYNGVEEERLLPAMPPSSPASFYKGIFITGSFNKDKVIEAYLKTQVPAQIILIDDRREYLEDANRECKSHSIPFLGILFKGLELVPGQPNPQVAEFQKKYLFEKAQWLEDEEAEKMLANKGK